MVKLNKNTTTKFPSRKVNIQNAVAKKPYNFRAKIQAKIERLFRKRKNIKSRSLFYLQKRARDKEIGLKRDLQTGETIGLTIDTTEVTIDDTNITIDSITIGDEYTGKFKTHQQIPVIVTDSDFTRKTRINDKVEIDYNIKLDETNNKLLDIR